MHEYASIDQPGDSDASRTATRPPANARSAVPYITQWSGERPADVRVIQRRGRLAYADERSHDRDTEGVLWRRIPSTPGRGKPRFGAVHAIRQRTAMAGLRCQVCGGPADRNEHGTLWLMGEDPDTPNSWPQGLETTQPSICLPCAVLAVRACPHLRQVAARPPTGSSPANS
jgi:ferredoxin